jgi:hypothetical protein
MTTRTHFAFRIDLWDATADNIVEHVAGASRLRWPMLQAVASRNKLQHIHVAF